MVTRRRPKQSKHRLCPSNCTVDSRNSRLRRKCNSQRWRMPHHCPYWYAIQHVPLPTLCLHSKWQLEHPIRQQPPFGAAVVAALEVPLLEEVVGTAGPERMLRVPEEREYLRRRPRARHARDGNDDEDDDERHEEAIGEGAELKLQVKASVEFKRFSGVGVPKEADFTFEEFLEDIVTTGIDSGWSHARIALCIKCHLDGPALLTWTQLTQHGRLPLNATIDLMRQTFGIINPRLYYWRQWQTLQQRFMEPTLLFISRAMLLEHRLRAPGLPARPI